MDKKHQNVPRNLNTEKNDRPWNSGSELNLLYLYWVCTTGPAEQPASGTCDWCSAGARGPPRCPPIAPRPHRGHVRLATEGCHHWCVHCIS